ncbi:hypothetical protein [Variovorax sp.]|jgi:hypothetical protein|uniref:hypothetical protein n=1 Tax=Variovorax sp. TaxID=1871043 RepID=UPI00121BBF06|nr:hypothetical protein [Variovorax sp.]TAJ62030.1 MAG: hypothetical protein EPO53_19925 [Variovorax sp.]
MSTENLISSARRLQQELLLLSDEDAILRETRSVLSPLVSLALEKKIDELPEDLPRPHFFFGMRDDCLAGAHLEMAELLNAITDFGAALRTIKQRGDSESRPPTN